MTISETLIQDIKKSKLTYNSVDTESYTEDIHDESYFAEGEEMNFELDGKDFTIIFDVEYTWRSVNSGGDGWNDENYDYCEDEESEITIQYVYDEDGEEYEADYKNDSELLSKLEKVVDESLTVTVK